MIRGGIPSDILIIFEETSREIFKEELEEEFILKLLEKLPQYLLKTLSMKILKALLTKKKEDCSRERYHKTSGRISS